MQQRRFFFLRNLFAFATSGGRLWLLPIIIILLVVVALAVTGGLTPYAAFLYPL